MAQKTVRYIVPTITAQSNTKNPYQQEKVAAYCRVSTKQDEQLNSYEVQKQYYTEKINSEPKWCLAGIYADKGITGTSTKNRDEFNKMIRDCKKGKIDRIITKSISRFARNTLDCPKYVRMLKELNIDIYFEEQGIHNFLIEGKYFRFCNNPVDNEPEKTCRDVGSRRRYGEKCKNDPIWKTYNQAYKTHYARYMKKKMTVSEFEQWSRFASELRDKAIANKIPFDEYYNQIRK